MQSNDSGVNGATSSSARHRRQPRDDGSVHGQVQEVARPISDTRGRQAAKVASRRTDAPIRNMNTGAWPAVRQEADDRPGRRRVHAAAVAPVALTLDDGSMSATASRASPSLNARSVAWLGDRSPSNDRRVRHARCRTMATRGDAGNTRVREGRVAATSCRTHCTSRYSASVQSRSDARRESSQVGRVRVIDGSSPDETIADAVGRPVEPGAVATGVGPRVYGAVRRSDDDAQTAGSPTIRGAGSDATDRRRSERRRRPGSVVSVQRCRARS